jgi:hypothetical protein
MLLKENFGAVILQRGNEEIGEISQITVKENEISNHKARAFSFHRYRNKQVRRHSSVKYQHHIWYQKGIMYI